MRLTKIFFSFFFSIISICFILLLAKNSHSLPQTNLPETSVNSHLTVTPNIGASEAHTIYLSLIQRSPVIDECIFALSKNDKVSESYGPLIPIQEYCGWLDDPIDYYYFELAFPTWTTLTLQNPAVAPGYPAGVNFALLDATETLIDFCCTYRKFTVTMTNHLEPGTYFVKVRTVDIAPLTYTLKLETAP